jgi:thiamine biosynthesis protein ThiI
VLVHYHEIALKGKNRPFFIAQLAHNLKRATADLGHAYVSNLPGRLLLTIAGEVAWERLRARVADVLGVVNFGRAMTVLPRDLAALKRNVCTALAAERFGSFRVTTKRADKTYTLNSMALDRELGAEIYETLKVPVSLTEPELTVFVEILHDRFLFSFERLAGPGGLPVGSSGRVIALLSGGIDSPVAAYRLMRRGCRVGFVHFHSFPLLDHTTIDKARSLVRHLTRFQYASRLFLVPFGPLQQAIVANCPAPLRVVLYRRFMVRIAEHIAHRQRAKALVTGDSLGQVASQTLDNLAVVNAAATMPVLRPLIGMDKDEIVLAARGIGTFSISTLPDMDCCQLFIPRHPATAANLDEALRAEEALDIPALLQAALAGVEDDSFAFSGD